MPTAITVTFDADVAREILIALRDRQAELAHEIKCGNSGEPGAAAIAAIAHRQIARVNAAGAVLATELHEMF